MVYGFETSFGQADGAGSHEFEFILDRDPLNACAFKPNRDLNLIDGRGSQVPPVVTEATTVRVRHVTVSGTALGYERSRLVLTCSALGQLMSYQLRPPNPGFAPHYLTSGAENVKMLPYAAGA